MTRPAVIIHSLDHVRSALTAAEKTATPLVLYSAQGAGAYAGAAWFLAVIDAARAEHPRADIEAVLDCGAAPGVALAALRAGCRAIVLRGDAVLLRKIAAIAAATSARLDPGPAEALDLRHCPDPDAALAAWLARPAGPATDRRV